MKRGGSTQFLLVRVAFCLLSTCGAYGLTTYVSPADIKVLATLRADIQRDIQREMEQKQLTELFDLGEQLKATGIPPEIEQLLSFMTIRDIQVSDGPAHFASSFAVSGKTQLYGQEVLVELLVVLHRPG